MSKYYTPSIEEFYVGFEYERSDVKDTWYTKICDIFDLYDINYMTLSSNLSTELQGFSSIEEFLSCKNNESKIPVALPKGFYKYDDLVNVPNPTDRIRVKYLDEEDIEELGFVYMDYNNKTDLFEFINIAAHCTIAFINDRLCIYKHLKYIDLSGTHFDKDRLTMIFNGIIKNKSELKKVLKMLNIL